MFSTLMTEFFVGIFHNDQENLFVWVNEEDQMRIVSMEKGKQKCLKNKEKINLIR